MAYEGPNYSGEQYILEKGVYRSCEDWGATDCHIASAQPILQVRAQPPTHGTPWARGCHGQTPTSPALLASRSGSTTCTSSPRSGLLDGEGAAAPWGVVVMLCPLTEPPAPLPDPAFLRA